MPLAYIFSETSKELDALESLALEYEGRVAFAAVNTTTSAWLAIDLNLKNGTWPAFAMQDKLRRKYPHAEQGEGLNAIVISRFVRDFLAGKVEPTIKSQPISETQSDGPVTVVVAHNYDDIVLDDSKDVLLLFYNPTCPACLNLAPAYDQLGAFFQGYGDKVVIAKVDETKNDVPDDIEVWPIIRLFRAGDKKSYIDFGGDPTAEDMAAFVRDNGFHHVNVAIDRNVASGHEEL